MNIKKILAIVAIPVILIIAGAPCLFVGVGESAGWCGAGMLWTLPWALILLIADFAYIIKIFDLRKAKVSGYVSLIILVIAIVLFIKYLWPEIAPLLG